MASELGRLIETARDHDAEAEVIGYALITFHRHGDMMFSAYSRPGDEIGAATISVLHDCMSDEVEFTLQ